MARVYEEVKEGAGDQGGGGGGRWRWELVLSKGNIPVGETPMHSTSGIPFSHTEKKCRNNSQIYRNPVAPCRMIDFIQVGNTPV